MLAAIRAAPDDDLPRLVYADWLEENGVDADRAAFIRAQIDAARAEPFSPAARDADARAEKLFQSVNRENWTEPLRGKVLDCRFERGFVEHAVVDVAQFADVVDALFDSEPVRSLQVVRPSPSVSEYEVPLEPFFAVPRLAQLTSLDLQGIEMIFDDCEKLAECPNLLGLAHLSLRSNPIDPPWLRRALESKTWPNLTSLDLADNSHLGPAISRAFRNADHRRFTRLDLSGVAFESQDLKRALACDCVSEVEELHMRWYGGDDRPGPITHLELGWVIPWERLRLIDLEGQGIGAEGIRELLNHEHAHSVRRLGLARNHLGQTGIHLLMEATGLHLYYLDVRYNDLRPKDALALQKRFPEAQIVV